MRNTQGLTGFSTTKPIAKVRWSARNRLVGFTAKIMLMLVSMLGLTASYAQASTNSNKVDVTLQASVVEALAIAVANPAIAFGIVTPNASNSAPAGQALAITSTWLLNAGETVKLYAYFDSATSAMTGVVLGDVIPTSAVKASFNGAATQSFSQTSPFTASATAINLYSVAITGANSITAARLDSLALSLNLVGVSLHSDTYVGTMHIQAQAL